MSLLLDALRKADRERRSGQPLNPFDEPPPPDTPRAEPRAAAVQPSKPAGSQRALLAVLWGILIAVLLLALVVWQRAPNVGKAAFELAAPTPMPTAALAPAPSTAPATLDAAPPPATLDRFESAETPETPETLYSLDALAMPALQPVDTPPPATVASVPARVVTEAAADEAAVAPKPSSAFLPPLAEVPVSTPPPAAAPPPLPRDVTPRRDLPAAVRDRIPDYAIDVHVYNDDPARRFILIRGERFGEGSTLEGGHRLLEIAPRGLVIDVDGQKVLIQRPG
jgi:general secretion pathway protein B